MSDSMALKKGFELDKFSTIIRVEIFYFAIELIFNQVLEDWKNKRDIRFEFHGKQPDVFGIMINEEHIVTKIIN